MPSLVILHIGTQWPPYLNDCVKQARLINPVTTPIVLIVNECHTSKASTLKDLYAITPVYIESLPQTNSHKEFLEKIVTMVDLKFRKQYWQYVFERFFILDDFCLKYPTDSMSMSMYMIETDNMVYVPLEIIAKTESLFSQGMAAPFDNLEQGYPSLVFFRNASAVSQFTEFMIENLRREYLSDMKILGLYRLMHPEKVFPYPVLPHSVNTPLRERRSLVGHTATKEETSFLSHPSFLFVFDAIAFGQALGGIDPRNTNGMNTVGYINESALYSVQETTFQWLKFQGLWFPLVQNQPLVNLHLHSKALRSFLSDRKEMPGADFEPKHLQSQLET